MPSWSSLILQAEVRRASNSAVVKSCMTISETPFSPKTAGNDKKTSSLIPCIPFLIALSNV